MKRSLVPANSLKSGKNSYLVWSFSMHLSKRGESLDHLAGTYRMSTQMVTYKFVFGNYICFCRTTKKYRIFLPPMFYISNARCAQNLN